MIVKDSVEKFVAYWLAQRLVKDWLPKHQSELAEMWRTQKIVELPPLD